MPRASRPSSSYDLSRVSTEKSWTAINAETRPASTIPRRNTAGSRRRSEPGITAKRTPRRGARKLGGGCTVPLGGGCGRQLGRDLVADAPDGDDQRRVAELAADLPDVDVDGARVARERVAPDALEQLVAGEHDPT